MRHRRRWCPFGVRPPWVVEDRCEWVWLYAAVEPTTGESFCLLLPRLDGACFAAFLGARRAAFPEGEVAVVLDGSGRSTHPRRSSGRVAWPDGLAPLPLPAHSPELNPAERLFERLRAALANRVFDHLADLERALAEALRPCWDDPAALGRLTAYPWWRQAAQDIGPCRR